jgi:putative membrane protein
MAVHIALMNAAAPLAAVLLAGRLPALPTAASPAGVLWITTTLQIALLWIWHAPSLQHAAMQSQPLQMLMHGTLFVAAAAFWCALLRLPHEVRWQAIPALLLTGKLACLLSALLIFAPRLLHGGSTAHVSLEDQQLAGLLMITACPLSYVTAGVILAAQIIGGQGKTPDASRTVAAAR